MFWLLRGVTLTVRMRGYDLATTVVWPHRPTWVADVRLRRSTRSCSALLADPAWTTKILAGHENEITAFAPAALGVLH